MIDVTLPGAEIVEAGLRDLEDGRMTVEALLVVSAATGLRRLQIAVPDSPWDDPDLRLYRLLEQEHGLGAHSKYNAWRRRLVSFLRSAACVS